MTQGDPGPEVCAEQEKRLRRPFEVDSDATSVEPSKLRVAGSSPVSRSRFRGERFWSGAHLVHTSAHHSQVAQDGGRPRPPAAWACWGQPDFLVDVSVPAQDHVGRRAPERGGQQERGPALVDQEGAVGVPAVGEVVVGHTLREVVERRRPAVGVASRRVRGARRASPAPGRADQDVDDVVGQVGARSSPGPGGRPLKQGATGARPSTCPRR